MRMTRKKPCGFLWGSLMKKMRILGVGILVVAIFGCIICAIAKTNGTQNPKKDDYCYFSGTIIAYEESEEGMLVYLDVGHHSPESILITRDTLYAGTQEMIENQRVGIQVIVFSEFNTAEIAKGLPYPATLIELPTESTAE